MSSVIECHSAKASSNCFHCALSCTTLLYLGLVEFQFVLPSFVLLPSLVLPVPRIPLCHNVTPFFELSIIWSTLTIMPSNTCGNKIWCWAILFVVCIVYRSWVLVFNLVFVIMSFSDQCITYLIFNFIKASILATQENPSVRRRLNRHHWHSISW